MKRTIIITCIVVVVSLIGLFVVTLNYIEQLKTPKEDICADFESEELTCLNLGITTVYLLKGVDGYLLIDTGFPNDYATFLSAMERVGVDKSEIKYLLLTHAHDDHAGFAAQLIEETGAKLIVHQNAVAALEQGQMDETTTRPLNWRVVVLGAVFMMRSERDFTYTPVVLAQEDFVVAGDDQDLLKSLGFNGEIIYTPGHTDDSISVVTTDGHVFCGDVAMNFLNVAGTHHRPIFVMDERLVFESWQKIIDQGATIIYPAHGEPFGVEQLAFYLEKYTEK